MSKFTDTTEAYEWIIDTISADAYGGVDSFNELSPTQQDIIQQWLNKFQRKIHQRILNKIKRKSKAIV